MAFLSWHPFYPIVLYSKTVSPYHSFFTFFTFLSYKDHCSNISDLSDWGRIHLQHRIEDEEQCRLLIKDLQEQIQQAFIAEIQGRDVLHEDYIRRVLHLRKVNLLKNMYSYRIFSMLNVRCVLSLIQLRLTNLWLSLQSVSVTDPLYTGLKIR